MVDASPELMRVDNPDAESSQNSRALKTCMLRLMAPIRVYIAVSIDNLIIDIQVARAALYILGSIGKTPGLPNRNVVIDLNLQIRTLLYVPSFLNHYAELDVYIRSCTCVYTINLHTHTHT